jgi:hypothetical protein
MEISIDFESSPRIITILAPTTEVTVQELVNALRDAEDDPLNMEHDHLISAAGKEPLGGGVSVGITVTLLNAKVAFEARLGPDYIQCEISGGNLVAMDENGVPMSPIQPTAFTQVVRASSSSATLMELGAIRYASYNGGVNLDVLNVTGNAVSGTVYPAGTRQSPSNNLADAHQIADNLGFKLFYIFSDATFSENIDLSGFTFIGDNKNNCVLTLGPSVLVIDCVFRELTIQGTLDGNASMYDCCLKDLDFTEGDIHGCEVIGELTLGGSLGVEIFNCYSGRQGPSSPAVIDMGGGGRNCAVHNWSGHLNLRNMTSYGIIGVSTMSGGLITIESTVSAGMVHIVGNAKVVDHHTGTAVIKTEYLLTPKSITSRLFSEMVSNYQSAGSFGKMMLDLHDEAFGKWALDPAGNTLTLYKADGATVLKRFALTRAAGAVPGYVARTPQ